MDAFFCEQCGWVYDPEEGSPEFDLKPGVAFSKLPGSFTCPECGCPKSEFVKLDEDYEYDFDDDDDDEEEDEEEYEDDDDEYDEDDEDDDEEY